MPELKAEFEFEIGDIVYFKTAEHSGGSYPKQLMIVERLIQQCHGGIQTHYKVGGFDEFIPSIVLTKTEPPYRDRFQELVKRKTS